MFNLFKLFTSTIQYWSRQNSSTKSMNRQTCASNFKVRLVMKLANVQPFTQSSVTHLEVPRVFANARLGQLCPSCRYMGWNRVAHLKHCNHRRNCSSFPLVFASSSVKLRFILNELHHRQHSIRTLHRMQDQSNNSSSLFYDFCLSPVLKIFVTCWCMEFRSSGEVWRQIRKSWN